jgi:hypothetical protein
VLQLVLDRGKTVTMQPSWAMDRLATARTQTSDAGSVETFIASIAAEE